jgi:hypothetical protein
MIPRQYVTRLELPANLKVRLYRMEILLAVKLDFIYDVKWYIFGSVKTNLSINFCQASFENTRM